MQWFRVKWHPTCTGWALPIVLPLRMAATPSLGQCKKGRRIAEMKIARMRSGAVLLSAHAPFDFMTPCYIINGPTLHLRNEISFHPQISTVSVRFKSFLHEQWKEEKKIKNCSFSLRCSSSSDFNGRKDSDCNFIVVNFYRLVHITDPEEEISKHLSFLQGQDIHGRIYINEQGINAQYSGPSEDALSYVKWLKQDLRFCDILVQVSPALDGHAFPRLKLQYKPSLVQLEGGTLHLPLLDPAMRATPLEPSEWRKRLEAVNNTDKTSTKEDNSDLKRKFLLLDVRNGYEWDVGHFHGARRPDVDCFRSTSFGLSESGLTTSDPLAGIDKEQTDILMYCTGGIRCDIYSSILRQKGFQNLYTLKGGVSHYLESEGPAEWVGNLFVFDTRLSLPPSAYQPEAAAEGEAELMPVNSSFGRCYVCGSRIPEFRHRNCANLDCNLLFLSCYYCVEELKGCCCSDCMSAPRLRPVLPGHQRYQKWHIYNDAKVQSE